MQLCNELEARLTKAQGKADTLLQAVLQRALIADERVDELESP